MNLMQMGLLYEALPTYWEQVSDWMYTISRGILWSWEWDNDLRPNYDVHLWTIPIEFAHSMLLFITILGLSRVKTMIRLSAVFGIMIYCLRCGKWASFEFLGGMLLSEIIQLQQEARAISLKVHEGLSEEEEMSTGRRYLRTAFYLSLVTASIFIGCWPNWDAHAMTGHAWMLKHTPSPFAEMAGEAPSRMWFALGAMAIVWSCSQLKLLQRLFETEVAQYAGRISYAIYIVHGPVLNMLQSHVMGQPFNRGVGVKGDKDYVPAVPVGWGLKHYIGIEGPHQREFVWLFGLLIMGPFVVWAADVFWRLVDQPVVEAARHIEDMCVVKESEAS